jgi:hypothetical protein
MVAVEGYDAMKKRYTRYIVITARKPATHQLEAVKEAKNNW